VLKPAEQTPLMAALAVRLAHAAGIPAEALPRVFDRFFRVDSSRSQGLGGTGLGLAIVQSIALLHGGRAEISSQPGQGTQVTLHIPTDSVVATMSHPEA